MQWNCVTGGNPGDEGTQICYNGWYPSVPFTPGADTIYSNAFPCTNILEKIDQNKGQSVFFLRSHREMRENYGLLSPSSIYLLLSTLQI